jgi:thymidine kinase/phosphatidylglycerophosphatase A
MGKIIYFYGVMRASKTAQLLTMRYNFDRQGQHTILIKPNLGDNSNVVSSRIGIEDEADAIVSLEANGNTSVPIIVSLCEKDKKNILLIDEAQFFKPTFIKKLAFYARDCPIDLDIYAFGLLKDFRNNMFNGAKAWLEVADSIREIKESCELCTKKATCNALETKDNILVEETFNTNALDDNIKIGDSDYHVYCATHMQDKINKAKDFYLKNSNIDSEIAKTGKSNKIDKKLTKKEKQLAFHYPDTKAYNYVKDYLISHGVSIHDMAKEARQDQLKHGVHAPIEAYERAINNALHKRDIDSLLMVGLALDEGCESKTLPEPLQSIMENDAPAFSPDETLSVLLSLMYSGIAVTNYGARDVNKRNLAKTIDEDTTHCNVFLDDFVSVLISIAEAVVAHNYSF